MVTLKANSTVICESRAGFSTGFAGEGGHEKEDQVVAGVCRVMDFSGHVVAGAMKREAACSTGVIGFSWKYMDATPNTYNLTCFACITAEFQRVFMAEMPKEILIFFFWLFFILEPPHLSLQIV